MTMGKIKVVALGGCGAMGKYAVQTALNFEDVAEIIIADREGDRAQRLAEQCGPRARFAQIDIENSKGLADLLTEADVVLNTVGPFYRFGLGVLRTSIDAGCHYLDINDDWEPTLEMLELDEEARKAGITALIGMGASSGLSNLLAVKAINALDQVEDIYTGWSIEDAANEPPEGGFSLEELNAPDYQPNAAYVHFLHQITGKIRIRRNGQFVDVRPMKKVKIDYPGWGAGMAWTVGHPEPLTLPRYYPDIKNSANVFVGVRKNINQLRLLAWLVNLRLISARRAAIMIEADEIKKRKWEKNPQDWQYSVPQGEVPLPPLFAFARGTHDGKPASAAAMIRSMPPGSMGGATGVPLALGLSLLAKDRITRRGAFAPEAGIDPDIFFGSLAPLCEPPVSGASELILITRSWENAIPDPFKEVARHA